MISIAGILAAAPHSFLPLVVEQPDGTPIRVYASGDEFHNWLHDADNYTIVRDDDNRYVYAAQSGEGVAPTDIVVGIDHPNMRGMQPGVNLSERLIAERYERMAHMRDYSNGRSPHVGAFNNLVVFIKFADDPNFSSPITYYVDMFNDSSTNANSMKNYFIAASYNQLFVDSFFYPVPNGTTIVTYVDINPRNYYRVYSVGNPIGYSNDSERTQREQQMLMRATNHVAAQIPNTLVIDGDNDGYVDNVCFIIQGSPDGWAELLWPHRWVLYAVQAFIHGKRVWDFNFQLETSLFSSAASVLAHEMFHSLGAPDLYRYTNNNITPIGNWDLMAGNANPPQHMSVWMKYRYGQWLTDVPYITQSGTYTLSPVASSSTNNIYRINTWRTSESYILEYRKPSGIYDGNLPGSGLLVYRLDTRYSGNAQGPPDELYIYRPYASNTNTNGVLSQANYSLQAGRRELSEATIPNGFTGSNLTGGLNLYDIGYAGDTITFKVKISDIQLIYPHGGETWFSGTNKTITWAAKTLSGNVNLEYSTNGGSSWNSIVTGTPNDGNYTWMNIPVMNSPNCHVRVTQVTGGHNDFNVYPFNIIDQMAVPTPTYPANNATGIPTNPQISWSNVPGATGYHFQLSNQANFGSFIVNLINHPTNSYMVGGLIPFNTYYWRVASMSDLGIGPFCNTQSFNTGDISELPSIPALLSPAHMATNLPTTITFNWSAATLAQSYWLQVARDPYFSNVVASVPGLTTTQHTLTNLLHYNVYYWRVSAVNVAGSSNFSTIRRFSTMAGVSNEDDAVVPVPNALMQNFPNPFNPSTSIGLSVKDPSKPIAVVIYNPRGQMIKRLFIGVPARRQLDLVWDGKDESGMPVSSGLYLYRFETDGFSETRKMLLMR
ncbi:MAG: M6 family metalloprotease domain-containing protein [Candidatus Cloacimonadaceae bacterium]|nr:M6 family metalloprotease domain-containing protein [Candidatus Cloacimonadaceae bacterium]